MSTIPQEAVYNPDPIAPECGYYEVNLGLVRLELDSGRDDWFVTLDLEGKELDAATIAALRDQLWRADELRRDLNGEPGGKSATARAVAAADQRDAAFLDAFGPIVAAQAPPWATTDVEDALSDSPSPEDGNEYASFVFRAILSPHFELAQIARFDPKTGVLELTDPLQFVANIDDEEHQDADSVAALIAETEAALAKFRAVL